MTREEFVLKWQYLQRTNTLVRGRCFYCGNKMVDKRIDSIFSCTDEHIYPKELYRHLANNIVQACRGCNNAKNNHPFQEFRVWRGKTNFFCEEVIKHRLPTPSLHDHLLRMVDLFYKKLRRKNDQTFG